MFRALIGRASGGRVMMMTKTTARTIYTPSAKTAALVEREDRVCAHTYHPLPVVLTRGKGCRVWDVDGKGAHVFLFFFFFFFFFFIFADSLTCHVPQSILIFWPAIRP